MRRKLLILIVLSSLSFLIWEAQAVNLETPPNYIIGEYVPHGWEEIELRGDLATSVGPNAIEAGANDDAIYIHFNQNLGNVSIKICNTTGVFVYNTVVNTDVQHTIIIPFSNAASGSYIVELSNATGYAEGDLEND